MISRPSVKEIHYLSSSFYQNAKLLSTKCKKIESKKREELSDDLILEHRAYFFSSIFNCVTTLESYINELFVNISDNISNPKNLKEVFKDSAELIKNLWELGIPKTASYSILEKYQIALILNKCEQFDKSKNPFQNTDALVKLRNALIHYEPEWIELDNPHIEKVNTLKIEKILKGKFPLSSIYDEGTAFFPIRIIGSGCSEWALVTVSDFVNEFNNKLGINK